MGVKCVIRTYRSGRVIEKSKFYVHERVAVRKGKVKGNTGAAKRDANARAAVKVVARTLNCNADHKDVLLTAKYTDEWLAAFSSEAEQDKLTEKFLRRLRYALKKEGVELRALWVHSEIDGETGRKVRPHVHIVLMGGGITFRDGEWWVGEKTMTQIWGMGSTYTEQLHDQADFTPLALYLLRQARRGENVKKYSCTRNLKKPEITETVSYLDGPVKAPAKALLLESGEYNIETGCHYIRYLAPEKKEDCVGGRSGKQTTERRNR